MAESLFQAISQMLQMWHRLFVADPTLSARRLHHAPPLYCDFRFGQELQQATRASTRNPEVCKCKALAFRDLARALGFFPGTLGSKLRIMVKGRAHATESSLHCQRLAFTCGPHAGGREKRHLSQRSEVCPIRATRVCGLRAFWDCPCGLGHVAWPSLAQRLRQLASPVPAVEESKRSHILRLQREASH